MKKMAEKQRVIEILKEIAQLLELKGENIFKIRAYENAARSLEEAPLDLDELIPSAGLEKLPGIGKHIAEIIMDLYRTGASKDYETLRQGFPESLFELFRISGLGAKRIKVLYEKLGIRSMGELEAACRDNRIAEYKGFGLKSQEKILQGIALVKKSRGLFLIDFATAEGEKISAYLKQLKGVRRLEIAGSLRRRKEVIKDIDILVWSEDPAAVHAAFVKYPEVETVLAHGKTKSSVMLKSGMPCDLRTVTENQFPYALYYFTGSKEHNVAVRTYAKKKSIKINEYGLFKGNKIIPCKDEAAILKTLGFHYIPPELRENDGEIEYAARRPCPDLIEESQIRGIFHMHSTYSDGRSSLETMIKTAQQKGWEYVGVADHSQSANYANGLDGQRLKKQWQEIKRLERRYKIRIFRGIESEILPDGRLDYPEALLAQFDFVIGAIHSHMNMTEEQMTSRVLRAMEQSCFTILAHPTGRLLLTREPYRINLPAVIDRAAELGVVIELNSHPQRLDLDWRLCRYAKGKGVLISINPDAHSAEGLSHVRYGVGIARKGWLEKTDVLNTLPVGEIEFFLRKRR